MQNPVCINHLFLGLPSGTAVPSHRGNVALSSRASVFGCSGCLWLQLELFSSFFAKESLGWNPIGGMAGQKDHVFVALLDISLHSHNLLHSLEYCLHSHSLNSRLWSNFEICVNLLNKKWYFRLFWKFHHIMSKVEHLLTCLKGHLHFLVSFLYLEAIYWFSL